MGGKRRSFGETRDKWRGSLLDDPHEVEMLEEEQETFIDYQHCHYLDYKTAGCLTNWKKVIVI
jgi:hypothetical protein